MVDRPPVQFPAIPRATDLQSVIDACNKLKDGATLLLNEFLEKRVLVERLRRTAVVRVPVIDGGGGYVEIERILEVTWENLATGELLHWNCNAPHLPPERPAGPTQTAP